MQPAIKAAIGHIQTYLCKCGIIAGGVTQVIICMECNGKILSKHIAHHGKNRTVSSSMAGRKLGMIRCGNVSVPGRIDYGPYISYRPYNVEYIFSRIQYNSGLMLGD